ncbi:MAG: outer membrane beta-barrel protein [Chitinophagales bacterium]
MLKSFSILFCLIFCFNISNAQEESTESTPQIKEKESIFQPIIIAGFNAAQVEGDDIKGYRKLGANVGGGVLIYLPKDFSLGFEILYSMKGARSSTNQAVNFGDIKIDMDYIDVPIFANYTIEDRLILGAGFIVNTLVRYRERVNEIPQNYEANPLALEIMANATFKFTDWFGINARISYSLTNVNKGNVQLISGRSVRKRSHNVLSLRAIFFI